MMSTSSRGRRRARRPSAAAGSAAQEMAQASEHPLTDSTSDSGQPQLVEEVTQRVLQALAEVNQKGKKRSQGRQGANSKKKRQRTPSTSGGEISGFSTIHGEISNYHTKEIPKCLEDTASRLLEAAVSQNTHQSYRTAMSVFQKYHQCKSKVPYYSISGYIFCGMASSARKIIQYYQHLFSGALLLPSSERIHRPNTIFCC
nr:uncharacterized protein LOC111117153 isoform X2 [Crassostrea virginica]